MRGDGRRSKVSLSINNPALNLNTIDNRIGTITPIDNRILNNLQSVKNESHEKHWRAGRPLTVKEMLEAHKKNKSITKPQPKYYECIQDRVKRQSSMHCITKAQLDKDREDLSKQMQATSNIQGSRIKLDIQNKIINMMLDLGEVKGPLALNNITKAKSVREERSFKANTSIQNQLNVAHRSELWLKRREEKIAKWKAEKELSKSFDCTFKPQLKAKYRLEQCRSTYKTISSRRISKEDINTIRYSNSYSQIQRIKRSLSQS